MRHRNTVTALLAVALTACGTQSSLTGEPVDGSFIAAAAGRARDAGTVKTRLSMHVSTDEEMSFRGEGAMDFRRRLTWMRMDPSTGPGSMEIITSPDGIYMRLMSDDPEDAGFAGTWYHAPLDDGALSDEWFDLSDPSKAFELLTAMSRDVRDLGRDRVDDVATTKYELTLDVDKAAGVFGGNRAEEMTDQDRAVLDGTIVHVWLDDNGLMRRQSFTIAAPEATMTFDMDFFDYGEPVDITVPTDAQPYDTMMSREFSTEHSGEFVVEPPY